VGKIEDVGLRVHCGARAESFVGTDGSTNMDNASPVAALRFRNEGRDDLPVKMVVASAGIKPRDELARDSSSIEIGERGGIVVDEQLRTTADGVCAIGEIAPYNHFIYGLIAPGCDMAGVCAETVARHDLGLDLGLAEEPLRGRRPVRQAPAPRLPTRRPAARTSPPPTIPTRPTSRGTTPSGAFTASSSSTRPATASEAASSSGTPETTPSSASSPRRGGATGEPRPAARAALGPQGGRGGGAVRRPGHPDPLLQRRRPAATSWTPSSTLGRRVRRRRRSRPVPRPARCGGGMPDVKTILAQELEKLRRVLVTAKALVRELGGSIDVRRPGVTRILQDICGESCQWRTVLKIERRTDVRCHRALSDSK